MSSAQFYVYISTDKSKRALHVGMIDDLAKKTAASGDSDRGHGPEYLLYFEIWDTAEAATARTRQIEGWHRGWQLNLVKTANPEMEDLSEKVLSDTAKRIQVDVGTET